MDERHWWLATKIQETFQVDGTDSPTALEQFLVDPNQMGIVAQFFAANGWNKIFVYGSRPERRLWHSKDLRMVTSLINVQGVKASGFVCVYFLRPDSTYEVEVTHLQRDVFCGEIKSNPLHHLSTVLSQVFVPVLKTQSNWDKCSPTQRQHFVHNVEKCVNVLTSATNDSEVSKQQILRLPKSIVLNDFKQHRISSQYDSAVVQDYEMVIQDWIQAIDGVLSEGSNERLVDMHSGPLTEVEKWSRRQRVLACIMEQLKMKECKNVISVLIQSKSKLVKKWKATDLFLTDAQNETKDKVKYLDTLEKHFLQLQDESNPVTAVNTILPAISNCIRQLETISKFYARSGFLGMLCKKICNRLVGLCREYVLQIVKPSHQDKLWIVIQKEIHTPETTAPVFKALKRGAKHKELVYADDGSLVGRLKACLCLHTFFRDIVRSLKEALSGAGGGGYSLPQSQSSLETYSAHGKKTGTRSKGLLGSVTAASSVVSGSDGRDYRTLSHGISMADEESILGPLDALCGRMHQLLDIIASLRQYTTLAKDTSGLPRPRVEDLVSRGEDTQSAAGQNVSQSSAGETLANRDHASADAGPSKKQLASITFPKTQQGMETLQEEEEDDDENDFGNDGHITSDDEARFTSANLGLDQDLQRQFEVPGSSTELVVQDNTATFWKELSSMEGEDSPGLCTLISDRVESIIQSMASGVTTSLLLDIQGRLNDKFEDSYSQFLVMCQSLDQLLTVYLAAIFAKPVKTQHGLAILSKFKAVTERGSVSNIIADHYGNVYATFGTELCRIQEMYDENKVSPVTPKNAPPASGAIYWSKQLLSHIEVPMTIFQSNKTLNRNKEYHRAVKLYNRLAKALITCETLWYKQWLKSTDNAASGLRMPLIAVDQGTGGLSVNVDHKFLQFIHDTKWMLRMNLDVPNPAKAYLTWEVQFKKYRMHLEQNLSDFKQACFDIPRPLVELFRPHTDSVLHCFHAGLSTLTWDSMNIDAYLHKISSATNRMKIILTKVKGILDTRVEAVLSEMSSSSLLDESLFVGKTWNCKNLMEAMNESIENKTFLLKKLAKDVEIAIYEVVNILATSRISSADHSGGHKQIRTDHAGARGRNFATGSDMDSSASAQQLDQASTQDVLRHYTDRLSETVKTVVCNSLSLLHSAIGENEKIPDDLSHEEASLLSLGALSARSEKSSDGMSDGSLTSSIPFSLHSLEDASSQPANGPRLKIGVEILFQIPDILLNPPLFQLQSDMDEIVHTIIGASKDLESQVKWYLTHLSKYDFLWKDDMHHAYVDFMHNNPNIPMIRQEVEKLLIVEKNVLSIPQNLPAGHLVLKPRPLVDALQGLAAAWKTQYSLILHEDAKKKLDSVVQYRNNIQSRLSAQVVTLDQLNSTLALIDEIHDMENKIDDVYLPIENMYKKLKEYDLRLARSELQQVDSLRDNWWELVNLADHLGHTLLKEERDSFEQELGKQLKTFVVEVIQFRNAFDAQGPAIPGVRPADAVIRLQEFQNRFTLYDAKRKTLDSVQQLFGIVPKPFPELEKTGEELKLLGLLYGLFQKFIAFDKRFRDNLWENVDLHAASTEVQTYWEGCLGLPKKLKNWDAYGEMTQSIKKYLDVLPLLHRLAKKGKFKDILIPEIRNRHWLQVMSVTFSKFQLESNVLKLGHLLDIGLLEHQEEILQICVSAHKELDLEVKMRQIEEEWTEQVLSFDNYKNRGPVLLIKEDSERLLEQLEDAQALLASMLTSKHIGPLREEAASWAEKLKGVSEVLDTWLETQNLWQQLESVFSDHITAKELSQEAKRFWMVDKSYLKLVKRAYDTRNILQCCYGGEVPKDVVLRHMQEELEICFKSLTQYLNKKRSIFPRFHFLSDSALLSVLSCPNNLDSVRPHLRSIFSCIADIKCEKSSIWSETASSIKSLQNTPTPGASPTLQQNVLHADSQHATEDHYAATSGIRLGMKSADSHMFSASNLEEAADAMHAVAVLASDGETLQLDEEVGLYEGAELWLRNLSDSVSRTVHSNITKALRELEENIPLEEIVLKYPVQIGRLVLLYVWTRECEAGISELKWERRALQNASKKYSTIVARLPVLLNRTSWKGEERSLALHRARLENLMYYSVSLRDSLDALSAKKIRDTTDFEWRRSIRLYSSEKNSMMEHHIHILENQIPYGMEFFGISSSSNLVISPATEKAFISMSIALSQYQGSLIVGNSGNGKTETALGLAHLLGMYMFMVSCTSSTDASFLTKSVQGLAAEGCWVCFDNVHVLAMDALSVLLDFSYKTMSSLAKLVKTKEVDQENEVTDSAALHHKSAIFITLTPERLKFTPLLQAVRSLFRSVSIAKPDVAAILKAKCTALGLRFPKALADKLTTVMELAHKQIQRPPPQHHEVSLLALIASLTLAAQKRRARDEQTEGLSRSDTVAGSRGEIDQKMSRSNSQSSVRIPALSSSPMIAAAGRSQATVMDKTINKKTMTSNVLTSQAKIDHGLVVQAIIETISPGLSPADAAVFHLILRDMFVGITLAKEALDSAIAADAETKNVATGVPVATSNKKEHRILENALMQVATDRGLVPNANWLKKACQLYQLAQAGQGIVLCGPTGCGKSSILSVLIDALCTLPVNRATDRAVSPGISSHKLQKLYPLTVDDMSLMFGKVNRSSEWTDGVLTNAWRKANRNQSTMWLCLDGTLFPMWADRFTGALTNQRVFHLGNGDRLNLTKNMRLVFETSDLRSAPPSLLSHTGLVYVDGDVLGWRPLSKAWLELRTADEKRVLQKAFDKTLDSVKNFVFNSRLKFPVCETGLVSTCLTLLAEMLNEHQQHIGGDLHIERLYLFCLIWSFGGLLEGNALKQFSDILRGLSSALPDYDHDISVFDYYVDESGEWDTWVARLPEGAYTGTTDMLGEVYVDTTDTIRTRCLLDFAHMAHKHTLLVGESGIGKTSLLDDFLDTQDRQMSVSRHLVFSHASTASMLHSFMHHNIHHRQGFVYGAKDGKYLELFIDDLNLPKFDDHGIQKCNELLRSLVDDQTVYKLTKPFECRSIEGLEVLATISLSASYNSSSLDPRLLRHFAVFCLRGASQNDVRNVIFSMLEANLSEKSLPQEIHETIAFASSELLQAVRSALKPSPLPGRQHYAFCLRQVVKLCQCLKIVDEENRASDTFMMAFWKHEVQHLFGDQLSHSSDIAWFSRTLESIMKQSSSHLGWDDKKLEELCPVYFSTFPTEPRIHHHSVSTSNKDSKAKLYPLTQLRDVYDHIQSHLYQPERDDSHNPDYLTQPLLSDDVLHHIIRIHRVLSYCYGGNLMIVGAVGSQLSSLTKLALRVAKMQMLEVDASRPSTFYDSLRMAIRIAGIEGKPIVMVLTARELYDPMFLDAVNSILISGEYPHLFSNDEVEGLLQVLIPVLRHTYPNMMSDPKKFFLSRVKCNLHIILNLPPTHKLLSDALGNYPGIVSETQILWIRDWPQEVLIQQAEFFINHESVAKETTQKTRECLTMAIANIHSLTLRDCKQAPWSGDMNPTITVTGTSVQTKKDKETIKVEKFDMPNLPYSKLLLLEQIKLSHRDVDSKAANETYIGPYTYRKFMHCLHTLFNSKSKLMNERTTRLQMAVDTLEETRGDVKMMQKAIALLKTHYQKVKVEVSDLFKSLTTEAMRLEKLKAHLGIGNGPLSAYLELRETEEEEYEDDSLLLTGQRDEYDDRFDWLCEANLKSKRVQVDEDIAEARKELDNAKASLVSAKAQVEAWRGKVDRGCIERLKAFQNPPVLVAQVLEMVMVLVGAHPYVTSARGEMSSQGGAKAEARKGTHEEGESRVSSSSTMRTAQKISKAPTSRHKNRRRSNFAMPGKPDRQSASVDRNKWKSMQNVMNDTFRFVEMIHGIDWENGLQDSTLAEVESYLKKGTDGKEGITGEGSLLDRSMEAASVQPQQRKSHSIGITISSARYSSEDAAVLVEYVISIVEYTRLCGPLKKAQATLRSLELELEVLRLAEVDDQKAPVASETVESNVDPLDEMSIEGLDKSSVEGIVQLMNEIQEKYDLAVIEKHQLQDELRTAKDRLHSSLETLGSLKSLEAKWRTELADAINADQLLTNCILAAAFQTYCGGMTMDARRRMTAYYTHVCNHYDLPVPKNMIFESQSYVDFTMNPVEIQSMRVKNLPLDDHTLDNACLLTASNTDLSWSLICDPSAKVVEWLNAYYSPAPDTAAQDQADANGEDSSPTFVQVLYQDLRSQLETSLSEGSVLLITYCDVEELASDGRFHDVFRQRHAFTDGKAPFKIMVGDQEVECKPNFRLFLHTPTLPQYVPPELAAYTTLVYHQGSRDGVKTELLDRFVRLEKPRLQVEWSGLQLDKLSNIRTLTNIEEQLKDILVSKLRLLNNVTMTRQLQDITKSFDEAMETKTKLSNAEQNMERAREGFTPLALRGAVLYEVAASMFIVNPLYFISWKRFLSLYDQNVKLSEHSALKAVCSQMTYNTFSAIAKGFKEEDRLLCAIMLALEVEDSLGNVGVGEREFLISPSYGSATMLAIGYHPYEARSQSKKIFDWLSDEQFQNILILGMYYEWFFESFDRMSREGREIMWRNISESDSPEHISANRLPDNTDDHYTPLQKLLIIRAVRSDRVVQASTEFVTSVLGKKFLKDESPDMPVAVQQSSPLAPIMLLFANDDDALADYLTKYVKSTDTSLDIIEFVGNAATDESTAVAKLQNCIQKGNWLFLRNVHLDKEMLKRLYGYLSQHDDKASPSASSSADAGSVHNDFRLLISCQAEAEQVPFPILHDSVKSFVDHPRLVKDNLLRAFSTLVDTDMISASSRPEWLPSVHNICILHGLIRLRAQFPINVGWQDPRSFDNVGTSELKASLNVLKKELGDIVSSTISESTTGVGPKVLSWSGLRYRVAELIYGNHTSNLADQSSLTALVDYWLASGPVKKDFELPKVKYRLPSVLFASNAKQSSILQSLEGISHHMLDCPEACNLHSSSDAVVGNDQYIFTRLNKIYDCQPESSTISHKLNPQPPPMLRGPHLTAISASSSHPWVVSRGVFASHSHVLLKSRKEIELWEICYNALSKVPKGWSKEYVSDRIKKFGGRTPFGLFLQKELDQLHALLAEVKRCLTSVKNLVESLDSIGDNATPEDVATADALFNSRIPPRWMSLAGETSPPDTTPLPAWLNDLSQRISHYEKMLLVGKDKMPAYWLGAFFNPHGLMAIFKQEALKSHLERYGTVDNIVMKTEITQRDKDHLRDPPAEGIFLHGVHLWGSSWEKTTGEMQDTPAKRDPTVLPVIHINFVPEAVKLGTTSETSRPVDYYACPVFVTTTSTRTPVFHLDITRENIPTSRWALRGLTATVRPY